MDLLTLRKLFLFHLRDIYSGEKQLAEALPRLVKSVSNKDLQMVLREDLEITKVQLSRIEEVCAFFSEDPLGENCSSVEGLLEEVDEMMEENESQDLIDLNCIGICQKVKHFQIAGYGMLITFAKALQEDRYMELMRLSLNEEYETDAKLSKLALDIVQIYSPVNHVA